MASGADRFFGADEIERARRYHRPLYWAVGAELALAFGVLSAFAFTAAGDVADGLPWWGAGPALAALVVAALWVAALPVSLYRHLHERRWGFGTQGALGWLSDRLRGLAVTLILTVLPLTALVAIARAWPSWWPVAGAAGAALLVLGGSFLGPVLFEPVFNRFAPLADDSLAEELRDLAKRAGVPVRDVLVADASRRTTKSNAYVSGLGRTRRVVLYDTLLSRARTRELRLVVAHELGHRRDRHVLKATLLAMGGAVAEIAALWSLLQWGRLRDVAGVEGMGDSRVVPFVLLAAGIAQLAVAPLVAAVSRRWERQADRFALALTDDPEAYEAAQRDLARANLADLDPPRALYLFLFSHPTPPERLAAAA